MDAFYAAVEVRDDPSLAGLPLVVGGSPQSRGVVATASYEARRFGIRSAMASAKAYRLCPQAVFVRPRFERYREVSQQVRAIFGRYSPLIEPLSLDEAYLDVTDHPEGLFAAEIARRIRADIVAETGLTASAGVAPNKMLAKIASELRKPDGLSVIRPEQVEAFMPALPVRKIHGIGPVSARKLAEGGVETCGDALALGKGELIARFGVSFGEWLFLRAQGIDERSVQVARERKSMGSETTFAADLSRLPDMAAELEELARGLADDLHAKGLKGRTVTLKVRFPDFSIATRRLTLSAPIDDAVEIARVAVRLLDETDAERRSVRLLGIALSKLSGAAARAAAQRSLFGD